MSVVQICALIALLFGGVLGTLAIAIGIWAAAAAVMFAALVAVIVGAMWLGFAIGDAI